MNVVKAYQQRHFCEDVDELKKLGGINHLFDKLKTSPTSGITSQSVDQRVKAFGSNAPPMAEVKSCFSHFISALNDLTLIILIVAAFVSTAIHMITEPEHRNIGKFSILLLLSPSGERERATP